MPQNTAKKEPARNAARRQKILDAAWDVFSQQGYERTSMDAVLEVCGGSKGTLYSYFKSKEELFYNAALTRSEKLFADVFAPFSGNENLTETLHAFCVKYLEHYVNSDLLEVFRLAVAEGKKLDLGRLMYEKALKKDWEKAANYFERIIPNDNLLPGKGWTAAMHLRGLLTGDALIRRTWGITNHLTKKEIRLMADNCVTAFTRIYAP